VIVNKPKSQNQDFAQNSLQLLGRDSLAAPAQQLQAILCGVLSVMCDLRPKTQIFDAQDDLLLTENLGLLGLDSKAR